jgi:hypothetical protein
MYFGFARGLASANPSKPFSLQFQYSVQRIIIIFADHVLVYFGNLKVPKSIQENEMGWLLK